MENLSVVESFNITSEVAKALRDIYMISFPAEERKDFKKIVESIKKRRTRLFISAIDNRTVGFASVTPLSNTDAIYLEYMAVEPKMRNKRIGEAILQHLKDKFEDESKTSGLIFEVERIPDEDSQEATIRKRRIEFYIRNGASIVTCAPAYRMPNLKTAGSVDMKLMWLPFDNHKNPPGGQKLKEYIKRIYIQAYQRNLNDPLLNEVLNNLTC
jgi:GNAT superfamily N-acetyltransferase